MNDEQDNVAAAVAALGKAIGLMDSLSPSYDPEVHDRLIAMKRDVESGRVRGDARDRITRVAAEIWREHQAELARIEAQTDAAILKLVEATDIDDPTDIDDLL